MKNLVWKTILNLYLKNLLGVIKNVFVSLYQITSVDVYLINKSISDLTFLDGSRNSRITVHKGEWIKFKEEFRSLIADIYVY